MSFLANDVSGFSDDELLDWYRGSTDTSAFIIELYRRFSDGVYLNAIKWLKDMPDCIEVAKDVKAEVFVKIILLADAKRLKARRIQPYLFVITRNECLAFIKKKTRVIKFTQMFDRIESEVIEIEMEEDDLMINYEREIMNQVRELDENKQKIIKLRYFDGMTLRKISEELDMKPTTVRGHLQYALKKLLEKIKK